MPLKILLADDSMTAQNMARKILSDAGYEVITVSNGAAALKKIAETAPDLVILDIYMPGYSGFEVCERVKRADPNKPVLLSVGKLEPYREDDALAVRANGVIVKPFEASELIATVEKVMPGAAVEAPADEIEIPSPLDTYEKYPAPPPVDMSGYQAATPAKPFTPATPNMAFTGKPVAADTWPEFKTPSPTDAAPAPGYPAKAASTGPFDPGFPPEVSKLTEGLGSFPPFSQDELQDPSARSGFGTRQAGGDNIPVPAKAAGMETPGSYESASVPFALDDLLNAVRDGQPQAAATTAPRAEVAPPTGGVVPEQRPQPGPPVNAIRAFAGMERPASCPPAASAPFSEDAVPPALPPAPVARAQSQNQPEAGQLDAPSGYTSKWRFAVRPNSAPPSIADLPATANEDDLLLELMPELEPQASPGADQSRAASMGGIGAVTPWQTPSPAPSQAPAPAMNPPLAPRAPSAAARMVAMDFGTPPVTPPPAIAADAARGPVKPAAPADAAPWEPLPFATSDGSDLRFTSEESAVAPAAATEKQAGAGGWPFSAPRMLEATAAMSFPAISGADHPDIAPARESAQAEHQEPGLPEHPTLDNAQLAAAVQHALELYKPLIVAEILRELNK